MPGARSRTTPAATCAWAAVSRPCASCWIAAWPWGSARTARCAPTTRISSRRCASRRWSAPSAFRTRPGGGSTRQRAGRSAGAVRRRGVPRGGGHAVAVRPVRRARAVVIRLDAVGKTYRTRRGDLVRAVEDVTLHVQNNEFVTLVGPSGCGKSTLLKLVAGLTPATRGTIPIRDEPVREPFGDVGFVFQQPVLLP